MDDIDYLFLNNKDYCKTHVRHYILDTKIANI